MKTNYKYNIRLGSNIVALVLLPGVLPGPYVIMKCMEVDPILQLCLSYLVNPPRTPRDKWVIGPRVRPHNAQLPQNNALFFPNDSILCPSLPKNFKNILPRESRNITLLGTVHLCELIRHRLVPRPVK